MSLTVLGCSKDKAEPSKTEILTDKNWIQTAYTVSPGIVLTPGGTAITDLYGQSEPCSKDDFIRFETPNVFKEDEGSTKCNSTDPQTKTGTWVFNADQTILTITHKAALPKVSISLNLPHSLKVSSINRRAAVTYTVTTTFRKG